MSKDKEPILRIYDLSSNWDGIYFHADIPVSFDAFMRIEQSLRDEGLSIKTGAGGGAEQHCCFKLGPFKELLEANKVIESIREKLVLVYENEQKYLSLMEGIVGDYPLYKK